LPNEQIEQAVVVDVGPDRGLRGDGKRQAGGFGHVGKGAVQLLRSRNCAWPAATAAQDKDVEAPSLL